MVKTSINMFSVYVGAFVAAYISSVLYFPVEVGGTAIVGRIVPLLILMLVIVNNIKKKYIVHKYTLVLILTMFIGGGSAFTSMNSILFYLNFVLLSLATYLSSTLLFERYGELFFYRVIKHIVIFSVFSSALGVFEYYNYNTTLQLWFFRGSPYYLSKGQVSSLYSNPNIFGIMTAISIQLTFMTYKSKCLSKSLMFLFTFVLFVGVLYSGARMAQALAVLVLLYNMFDRLALSPFKMVFISYVALISMSIGFGYLLPFIDLNFIDVIWGVSKNIFLENVFFGVGMGNLQDLIPSSSSLIHWSQGPNNFVWGFLAECGLIFFMMFSYLILKPFLGANKHSDLYVNLAFLMSVMLISQFSEHFIIYVSPYVMIFFLILAVASKPVRFGSFYGSYK